MIRSGMGVVVNKNDKGIYTVRRRLKARNAFNALIPATFECKLKIDEDNFYLLSIKQIK